MRGRGGRERSHRNSGETHTHVPMVENRVIIVMIEVICEFMTSKNFFLKYINNIKELFHS